MQLVNTQSPAVSGNLKESITSTPKEINSEVIKELISKEATRKNKNPNIVRESLTLNKSKLFSTIANILKSYRQDYGSRLPNDIAEMLSNELDVFIEGKLKAINSNNALTYNRRLVPNFRDFSIEEKVTASGKNQVQLQYQLTGINSMIERAEINLKEIRSGNRSGDESKISERLGKLEMIRFAIKNEIEKQSKLEGAD